MDVEEHIKHLERDAALLGDAAQEAGLDADVPSCPGWQVRDLVRHVSYVHNWAARHVREQSEDLIGQASEADILGGGPPDDELLAAYREGHASLVRTLREADPGVKCAAFLPAPSPLAFWARRQAHETAIHRFDAQLATAATAAQPSSRDAFDPALADDGIDELLMGFVARRGYKPGSAEHTLAIRPTDTAGRWHVLLSEGGRTAERADRPAGCVLEGPASALYAFLWNRCESGGIAVSGDPGILDIWDADVRVRW